MTRAVKCSSGVREVAAPFRVEMLMAPSAQKSGFFSLKTVCAEKEERTNWMTRMISETKVFDKVISSNLLQAWKCCEESCHQKKEEEK